MSEPFKREQAPITGFAEWMAMRRQHVTASRVAALFDAHPYLTREGLAYELRAAESAAVPNRSMRDGHILEAGFPVAVRLDGKPWELVKATTYHWLPEVRLGCTPDFFIDDDGLLQAKTVSPEQWAKWRGTPPLAYSLQTLCELLVTGRAWGVLAIMVRAPGHTIHYYDVPRHGLAEQRILDAVAAWWRAFDTGALAPAVSPQDIAADLDDGSHVDLSASNELPELLEQRAELKVTVSSAEKELSTIDEQLKAAIGSARTAWVPGWNITYAMQHRKETVLAAKDIRVLRVRRVEEEEAVP